MPNEITNIPREETMKQIARSLNIIAVSQAGHTIVPDSWENVRQIIRQGIGNKAFPIGSQLKFKHDHYGDIVCDVVAHDYDKNPLDSSAPSMTLLFNNCVDNVMFDNTEALYYCENALSAGTYHFSLLADYDPTYGGGKTYEFTLTKPVPQGGVIMFPWSSQSPAVNTIVSTYPSRESTTAIESVNVTEGNTGTNLGTADGNTPNMNHSHRIRYGSNNWEESALRQWLNSDKDMPELWSPKTIFDRPPTGSAYQRGGFLKGIDAEFLSVLGKTKHTIPITPSGSKEVSDLFFPPSRKEIYGEDEVSGVDEGTQYPFFASTNDDFKIKYLGSSPRYWWLRTPYSGFLNGVRCVVIAGALYYYGAFGSLGVAAACVIY